MKYLLNIFDLDGTLIDSHEAICKAMNDMLKQYGLPLKKYEELKKMIGIPLEDMFKAIDIRDIKKGFEDYRHYYFQYIEKYQRIYDGIKELLDSLHNRVLLAIATNKGRNGTIKSLKAGVLEGYFDYIVTEHELDHLKPHTEPFEKIIDFYKSEGKFLEKEDVLMIGDSPVDIEFAGNCGIDSVFVKWGFNSENDLAVSPTYVISKPEELIKIDGIDEVVEIEITNELDLHTFQPKEVGVLVKDYLKAAHEKGFRTVRIVHGKGIGIQRKIVQDILKQTVFVKNYYDAPLYSGGLGATIAEID